VENVALFPGVNEVHEEQEYEPDYEEICAHQADIIARWKELGREIMRRAEVPLPFDLALDLNDLLLIDTYL
jgi:hypothetical protein